MPAFGQTANVLPKEVLNKTTTLSLTNTGDTLQQVLRKSVMPYANQVSTLSE